MVSHRSAALKRERVDRDCGEGEPSAKDSSDDDVKPPVTSPVEPSTCDDESESTWRTARKSGGHLFGTYEYYIPGGTARHAALKPTLAAQWADRERMRGKRNIH